MSHGGRRERAGRPSIYEGPKERRSFTLSQQLIAALELELEDRLPEQPSLSMSELVEALLREHVAVRGWMEAGQQNAPSED